MMQGQEAR